MCVIINTVAVSNDYGIPCKSLTLTKTHFSLGFQNVVTIDMLREAYPLLDMVDHNRRPKEVVRNSSFTVLHFSHGWIRIKT